jgi:hypothetical protein
MILVGTRDYIPTDLKISEPSVPGKKKKPLVLTLGNPSKKGEEKKSWY